MVQTALKDLCNALTATAQYVKQTHLCAAYGGFSIHKITNDIYEHLDDATDRLKELYISIFQDRTIAKASSSLAEALALVQNIPNYNDTETPQVMVKNCVDLLSSLAELINNIHTDNKGLENALGDICETIQRDNYLLKMEVKNAG